MSEKNTPPSKGFTIDWLVRGVLTRAGDAFDNFTGRKWQPSSNLATSQIIEKLKALVDAEVRDLGAKGRFVPHSIRLKVEWETFGSDSGELLQTLERELTVALIDHINDCRYHTYAPIDLQVKTDYFTKGIKLSASFDDSADGDREIDIAGAQSPVRQEESLGAQQKTAEAPEKTRTVYVQFGEKKSVLTFEGRGRATVGRTPDSDLVIEHPSVSKSHAALVFNEKGLLLVADVGSTNGTWIGKERIPYGKTIEIRSGSEVVFGELPVRFEYEEEAE